MDYLACLLVIVNGCKHRDGCLETRPKEGRESLALELVESVSMVFAAAEQTSLPDLTVVVVCGSGLPGSGHLDQISLLGSLTSAKPVKGRRYREAGERWWPAQAVGLSGVNHEA